MNIEEWKSRLFVELVQRVGTPGDPLFLYVDEDALAKCADGLLTPDDALADFCRAFNTTGSYTGVRFSIAARQAWQWELSGFEGPPPFIDALVMTVLAVTTRPSAGFELNVYARQRELLGMRYLDEGAPSGYIEYVPGIWKTWNRWLTGPGADYGLPTAAAPSHWPNQGFARSQSFIRPRDKEDIYEFFGQVTQSSTKIPSPADLLDGLTRWLERRSSRNPRLLDRARDAAYRDEFRAFLPTSFAFWKSEEVLAKKRHDLGGLLLWNPESDHMDMVANIRDVRGLAGEIVQLMNTEPYLVASDDTYLYLYDEETDEGVWFDDAITAWPLHERLTVSWLPRSSYLLAEAPFFGWVETHCIEPGHEYRILLETSEIAALDALEIGGHAEEAKVPGWSWLVGANFAGNSLDALEELLSLKPSARRPRSTALTDGLPLGSGNRYLEGGEPDIRIGLSDEFISVLVDGRDRLGELLPPVAGPEHLRLQLSKLALNPGPHSISVLTSVGESNHTLTTVAPDRPTGHWYLQASYRALALQAGEQGQAGLATYEFDATESVSRSRSLVFRPGSSAFAIASNGDAFTVVPSTDTPAWLANSGMGYQGEIETFLETSEISLPDVTKPYDLIYRRNPRSAWFVRSQPAREFRDRFPATNTQLPSGVPPALIEFITADKKAIDTDNEAGLSNLRQSILNARATKGPAPANLAAPLRHHPVLRGRHDLGAGPSMVANPFNDFLDWMSEQEAGYCSLSKASRVFSWLWRRSCPSIEEPHFTFEVLRRLHDLGHVMIDKPSRRLWIAPTVLATLPNARSLRVLAGSRSIEFVAKLRSGEDDAADAGTSAILQNMTFHELHQTDRHGTPLAPDVFYVQLASSFLDAELQSASFANLRVGIESNLSVRMIERLPRLRDRLDGRQSTELPLKSRLHVWQEGLAASLSGRWREASRLPEIGEHFLKVNTGHSTRYVWWNAGSGTLSLTEWAYGRWMFEAVNPRLPLLLHKATTRQLLVASHIPLPGEVSKALVARTGILPRQTVRGAHPLTFTVFENISIPLAETVADVLGQPKGSKLETSAEITF